MQSAWNRIPVQGKPHKHSFYRDRQDIRIAKVIYRQGKGFQISGSIDKLLILKTTGSAFHGFIRDKYTTLAETHDRLFSTEVYNKWEFRPFDSLGSIISKQSIFDKVYESVRTVTLKVFAEDDSASVQATMYKMAQEILSKNVDLTQISYVLPNKHYFMIPMGRAT